MGHESYHEPLELLSERTRNMHRAIVSLIEELEAIDWYEQRAEACSDAELQAVLRHNKEEEIEHAMMSLEWIRRNSPEFDAHMKTYLSTTGPITEIEEHADGAGGPTEVPAGRSAPTAAPGGASSLGIGSLRGA